LFDLAHVKEQIMPVIFALPVSNVSHNIENKLMFSKLYRGKYEHSSIWNVGWL